MSQRRIKKCMLACCLLAAISSACSYALPLPAGDISLNSPLGQLWFAEANNKSHFAKLSADQETEVHPTYCGVASSVMVLNALGVPHHGFLQKRFTQYNVLTSRLRHEINMHTLMHDGLSSPNVVRILEENGVHAHFYPGNTTTYQTFMDTIQAALANPHEEVIAHFSRGDLNQVGGGHFSPIAAYDSHRNAYLIMDVASYKYPPFWVNAYDLWEAMLGFPKARGFTVVSRSSY